jgi:hypothetical protein
MKRLEALERTIIARPPELIFVWSRAWLPGSSRSCRKATTNRVVCFAMPDEDGSFEASLRGNNPHEAERLDALLRGESHH